MCDLYVDVSYVENLYDVLEGNSVIDESFRKSHSSLDPNSRYREELPKSIMWTIFFDLP